MTSAPSAPAPSLPLRANRDFRLIWVGGLLAGFGSQVATLALPLLVLADTGSPTEAGLVSSVSLTTLLIAMLPGGAVADTVERRRLMVWCEFGSLLASAALSVAVLAGHPALALIMLVTVAGAVLGSLFGPASSALLRAAVPEAQLGAAVSRLQARSATARLAGPLVGGALFGVGHALPFFVETIGLGSSVLCLLAVRARAVPGERQAKAFTVRHVSAGLVFILHQPYLRTTLTVFGFGMNAAFGGIVLAAIASSALADPSGRSSGVFATMAAAGMLAGALLAPKTRAHQRPRAAVLLSCWACACTAPALAFVPSGAAMGAVLAPCLLVAAVGNVAFMTMMVLVTPQDLIGRVQSAAGVISMIAQPIGPLAGGLLLNLVGQRATFLVLGAVLVTAAVVATIAPGLRTAPTPAAD
jgi:MFS family permease